MVEAPRGWDLGGVEETVEERKGEVVLSGLSGAFPSGSGRGHGSGFEAIWVVLHASAGGAPRSAHRVLFSGMWI